MTHELAASGVVSLDDLRTFARNRRGEPGAAALAKALDLPHTRSEMNDPIAHICVDCHWPANKTWDPPTLETDLRHRLRP
jgi:hypothetical protein